MIPRSKYLEYLQRATRRSPITALLGARQVGKTTLARAFTEGQSAIYYDLESLPDQRRLQNPELALGEAQGLVILDEIQRMPELFSILRVLVDRPGNQARYVVLGSASPNLVKHASESLAGRVEFIELNGFELSEIGSGAWKNLWLRGGFPRAFLAESEEDSLTWREGFIRTFLERDLPQLGASIPTVAGRRFWSMLAHYHGQTWNASEISRAMGLSDKSVRNYLDILTGSFMVRQLQPWFTNIKKRQVRAPKIYLRDTGLLHSLLNISDMESLLGHPKVGSSWEGFVIDQALSLLRKTDVYFWATHSGAELDLLFFARGKSYGIEVKFSEAPKTTRSIYTAIHDLELEHMWIIYPGMNSYPVERQISVLSIQDLDKLSQFASP